MERIEEDWGLSDESEEADAALRSKLASRIRQDNAGLNVLGRSVEALRTKSILEDGEEGYKDKSGFSKPLSPAEFEVFREHMKEEYDSDISRDDIAVEDTSRDSLSQNVADNDYLANKWLSSKAMKFMDGSLDEEDPFSDLLPSDLSPSRLVNRKNAKPIPKDLLHQNNLALLRRYITPTGQIMSRMHSRLGAKDQRKVAKLIKRARHLGLIPHSGQFAVEAHGNIYEKGIEEDNEWEKELKRRGIVVRKQSSMEQNEE